MEKRNEIERIYTLLNLVRNNKLFNLIGVGRLDPVSQEKIYFSFLHALVFKSRFCEILKDRTYDINKQGDYQKVCRAMLRAYKETCNPKLRPLVEYYIHSRQEEVKFNKRFLNDLVFIIKNDQWFQS